MNNHRYILGIGSQRAGSTLLHGLMEKATDVFMHPLKELHYFDTLYGYRSKEALKHYSLNQINREINRIVAAKNYEFMDDRYRCYLRSNKILACNEVENIEYQDLFRPFLSRYSLLGEITPEYMLLDELSIIGMKAIIGADAGIILICRNPVDRVLSAAKLFNVYNNLKMDSVSANRWLHDQLEKQTGWMQAQDAYNDYSGAMKRYSRHFNHVVAIAYENLISAPVETASQLAEKLNITVDGQAFSEGVGIVVNDLGDSIEWSREIRDVLQARYAYRLEF